MEILQEGEKDLTDYYTKNLEKVKKSFGGGTGHAAEKGKAYIEFAQGQLDAYKKGGEKEVNKYRKSAKKSGLIENSR